MKLQVVSIDDPAGVQVVYMGEIQTIPKDIVEFEACLDRAAERDAPAECPGQSAFIFFHHSRRTSTTDPLSRVGLGLAHAGWRHNDARTRVAAVPSLQAVSGPGRL